MLLLYLIIVICLVLQAERGIFDTLSYIKLFKELRTSVWRDAPVLKEVQQKRMVYVLIPVFREQSIIEETIRNFCKIKHVPFEIRIIIIPTIREEMEGRGDDTTECILKESLKSGSLLEFRDHVQIIKATDKGGSMASQLNFATEKLRLISPPETLFMVYNADSQISNTTFTELFGLLQRYRSVEFAFQQPCAYVKEMKKSSSNFLNALSLFQSWYCLGHESRLVRKYGEGDGKSRLGVIIGHGSGMTLGIHKNNGMYPEDFLTEDLTFGFIISANRIPILPLPALELADVPGNLTTFILQKSVWFWNYLSYTSCYKKARSQGHPASKLLPLVWQGIAGGAYWFFSALFIIVPITLSIALGHYWMAGVFIITTFVFCIVPQYILFKKLPAVLRCQGFMEKADEMSNISFARIFPSLCLINLTDSVGAWIASYKYIHYLITDRLPAKYKTEG